MSYVTGKAEIGEGDHIQVRVGPEDQPERVFDVTVTNVTVYHQSRGVLISCEITSEVPQFVLEQIRNPTPSERSPRWWR